MTAKAIEILGPSSSQRLAIAALLLDSGGSLSGRSSIYGHKRFPCARINL